MISRCGVDGDLFVGLVAGDALICWLVQPASAMRRAAALRRPREEQSSQPAARRSITFLDLNISQLNATDFIFY